jgi:cytochrome c5
MPRRTLIFSLFTIAMAAAAMAAAQKSQTAGLPDGPGKQILGTVCTECHSLDEVTKFKGYYSKENWRDIVRTMVADGALLKDADVPVLIDYLTKAFPREFPDGPEKKLVETACSGCHPIADIRKVDGYLDKDDWTDLIRVMAAKGAKVGEGQIQTLAEYLSSTFPRLKRN